MNKRRKLSLTLAVVMMLTFVFGYFGKNNIKAAERWVDGEVKYENARNWGDVHIKAEPNEWVMAKDTNGIYFGVFPGQEISLDRGNEGSDKQWLNNPGYDAEIVDTFSLDQVFTLKVSPYSTVNLYEVFITYLKDKYNLENDKVGIYNISVPSNVGVSSPNYRFGFYEVIPSPNNLYHSDDYHINYHKTVYVQESEIEETITFINQLHNEGREWTSFNIKLKLVPTGSSSSSEDIDTIKQEIDRLNAEKAKLEKQIEDLNKTVDSNKTLIEDLNKKIQKLEQTISDLTNKVETNTSDIEAIKNEKAKLEKQIEDLTKELNEIKANGNISDEEKAKLEEDYNNKITELEKQIEDLNTKIKELEEKLNEHLKEKENWENKLSNLEKELAELKENADKTEEEKEAEKEDYNNKIAELEKQIEELKNELKKDGEVKETETDDKKNKTFIVETIKDGATSIIVNLPDNAEIGDKVIVLKNDKEIGNKVLTRTDISLGKITINLTERVKKGDTLFIILQDKKGDEKASTFESVEELTDEEIRERLKILVIEARAVRDPSEDLLKALDNGIDVLYDRYSTITDYKWAIEDLERELDKIRHNKNNRFKLELNEEPVVGDTELNGITEIKWYVDAYVNNKRVAYTQADTRGNFTLKLKNKLNSNDKLKLYAVDPRNENNYKELEYTIKGEEKRANTDKNLITEEMLRADGLDPKEVYIFPTNATYYNIVKDGQKTTVNMDGRSYNDNGRVMMPIRYVAYALGFNVEWDKNTREAIFTNNSNPVLPKRTIRVQADTGRVYDTDGNNYSFDRKPVFENNRIYVSISNIAKAFGASTGYITDEMDQTIEWDQARQAVYVFKYVK